MKKKEPEYETDCGLLLFEVINNAIMMLTQVVLRLDEIIGFESCHGACFQNDIGGSVDPNKFITFVKARLVCSVSGGGNIPVYYNELCE